MVLKVYLSTPERRAVGQRFNVEFNGKRILTDISGDPAKRTAVALRKIGHTGLLAIVAENGKTRCVIDIEKSAGGKWRPLLERNTRKKQSVLSYE